MMGLAVEPGEERGALLTNTTSGPFQRSMGALSQLGSLAYRRPSALE